MTMRSIKTIAVFCGSNYGASEEFANGARALGRVLGKAMVYGGTTKGLMGVVADAALASGGNVHGVITESLHRRGQAHFPFYCLAANAEKASSGSLKIAQDEAPIPQQKPSLKGAENEQDSIVAATSL